jgi:hypothetical protein
VRKGEQLASDAATECPKWVNRVILAVGRRLPIFPRKRTSPRPVGMSQTCHKQIHAAEQNGSLFDHLVGATEQ